MARASSFFGGQYFGPDDLNGKPLTVKIEYVTIDVLETQSGQERERIVLHLEGQKKHLICNATIGDVLIDALGDETESWPGNTITITKNPRADKDRMKSAVLVTVIKKAK
jgi:hypothetical protein